MPCRCTPNIDPTNHLSVCCACHSDHAVMAASARDAYELGTCTMDNSMDWASENGSYTSGEWVLACVRRPNIRTRARWPQLPAALTHWLRMTCAPCTAGSAHCSGNGQHHLPAASQQHWCPRHRFDREAQPKTNPCMLGGRGGEQHVCTKCSLHQTHRKESTRKAPCRLSCPHLDVIFRLNL